MKLKIEVSSELFTVAENLLKAKDAFNKEVAKMDLQTYEIEVEEFNLTIALLLRTVANFSTLNVHEDYFKQLGYNEMNELLS